MEKHIKLFFVMFLFVAFSVNAQNFNWIEQAGSTGKDYGNVIATDKDGNLYVGGEFSSTGVFGSLTAESNGNVDYFVAKYDSNHVAQWVNTGGGTITDRVYALDVDDEGFVYAAGHFFGTAQIDTASLTSAGNLDMFVMKLNPEGEAVWVKQVTGTSQVSPRALDVDSDGNIAVAGYFGSSSSTEVYVGDITLNSNGNRDCLVFKMDNDGNVLWANNIGGENSGEEANDVSFDNDGNVYLTGMFAESAYFDGTLKEAVGGDDVYLVKYAANGSQLWVQTAGGLGDDESNALSLSGNGFAYIAGSIDSAATFGTNNIVGAGNDDAFLAKYDLNGNSIWAKVYGGVEDDFFNDIDVDNNGNVYGTGPFEETADFGTFQFTSAGNYDVFFVKVTEEGGVEWATTAGGTEIDRGESCVVDNGGNMYSTGRIRGTASFDGQSVTSAGSDDIFITRIGFFTVPVELSAFSASQKGNGVVLNWSTATETNNAGFEIEKSVNNSDYIKIAFVDGKGTSSEINKYTFADNSVQPGTVYYRLKQIDYDGSYTYSKVVEVELTQPEAFALMDNYPNPFNPSTTIKFNLPVDAKVNVSIFNALGQLVSTLADGTLTAGVQTFKFNASGLSSGMYLYRVTAEGINGKSFTAVKKMILMK